MDRVFLDANVLFSAAYSAEAGIAALWDLRHAELLTSTYAAGEARANLSDHAQLRRLQHFLLQTQITSGVSALPANITLPEKDQPILGAAIYLKASHLLTGDKQHFGQYFGRRLGGVLVLSPGDYLHHYHLKFGKR